TSPLLAHAQRLMLLILAQALALLACVLVQCRRTRATSKGNETVVKPDPPRAADAVVVPAQPPPRIRPEPGSRIFRQSTLSNGMRVATEAFRVKQGDRAVITVIVGAGSRHETESLNGIAHYTEHMILRGATPAMQLKSFEYAHDDRLGGSTTTERTEFHMYCREAEDAEPAIALLARMIVDAHFQDENVERERRIIQAQCMQSGCDIRVFALECLHKVAYHPNPLGLFTGGQLRTNEAITALDICRFYDAHYKSTNTIITAVGDVDHEEIVRWAEYHFKDYAKGDARSAPTATWKHEFRLCLTSETDSFFVELAVQGPSDFWNSEDGLILQLFNYAILCKAAPIFSRHNRHVNDVMSLLPYKEFTSVSQCFFTHLGLHVIIARWRYFAYGFTAADLEQTKEHYKIYNQEKGQCVRAVSCMLNLHMFHTGRHDSPDKMWSRVQAITIDRFRAVAKRILLDGEFTLVGYVPSDHPHPRLRTRKSIEFHLRRAPITRRVTRGDDSRSEMTLTEMFDE
ncbi:hypothetical protein PRIPAC_94200, partial [Pristionchus pacificus]